MMLKFAIYVSNHGFGHARRMAALAGDFIKFGIFVHIRSGRPDFLFGNLDPAYHRKDDVICDFGVISGENFELERSTTQNVLFELMGKRLEIIQREVEFLREEKIDLIISDIPWLVVEAGTYANIPVFAISNFDWLYIYKRIFASEKDMNPLLNTIFGLYQRVDRAFRLPFSSRESMGSFRKPEKVGLLAAKKSKYADIRGIYGLEESKPLLTCTFGGGGEMDIDLKTLCDVFPGYVLSTSDLGGVSNHIRIDQETDFTDIIKASDILLTKPGYSSFAEAVQFGKHLIYKRRGGYPEDEILVAGLAKYPHKLELDELDISRPRWRQVFKSISLGMDDTKMIPNGNAKIAALILKRFIELRYHGRKLRSIFDVGSNNINYALCEDGKAPPIHATNVTTGLGRKFKPAGKRSVAVPQKSIRDFKKAARTLISYDRNIDSLKQAIATGIHRRLEDPSDISEWFAKSHNIPFRVLGEHEEAELAWLAARELIEKNETAMIIDIGGFSTEFITVKDQGERCQTSIPLGLLILRDARDKGLDTGSMIQHALSRLDDFRPQKLVIIGLTASLLARIVNKEYSFVPERIHRSRIDHAALAELEGSLENTGHKVDDNFDMNPQTKEIIHLSAGYLRLLLDKYQAREFIVNYYGISAGYNLWHKRKKIKNQAGSSR